MGLGTTGVGNGIAIQPGLELIKVKCKLVGYIPTIFY
jgi:hypothetical protein